MPENSVERQQIVAEAELLGQLLLQDVERTDNGVGLKDGVSRDRMMSVHDPEMRHGHKSSRRRFDVHKAAIVVDTDSQLITAVEVLPDNATDNLGSLDQRQLVLLVGDDYFCRSNVVIIRYRRCRIGYGSASRNTEAETNGRKDATDGGGNGRDERALGPQVAVRPIAVGDQD